MQRQILIIDDHDAASDVVQQTLCKAMERLHTYRGEAALYTWFCQICRHTLIDQRRATQRIERFVRPLEDEPDIRAVLEAFAAPVEAQPDAQAWHGDIQRLVQATMRDRSSALDVTLSALIRRSRRSTSATSLG